MSERPPVDDELEDIFKRPSDVAFAQRLHEVRGPAVEADPAFREALRRSLMQEAWKQKEPRRPWYRRLLGPPGLAWAAAMAGVLLIVFVALTLSQNTNRTGQQVFTSPINGHTAVATSSSIVVKFQQPMNPVATQQAAKITPATEASYHWSDNNQTLTIVPKNDGLAPGVTYQVTFTSAARTESNQPLTSSTASPAPITFVTQEQPQPTPRPTPVTTPASPSPTPTPSPLSGVRLLGASNGSQPVWSLDGTQIEAAKAVGFTKRQTLTLVILPQMTARTLPALTGQFASIIKDSSLLSIIAVIELTQTMREISATNLKLFECYLFLGVLYLALTLPITFASKRLEKKFSYEN